MSPKTEFFIGAGIVAALMLIGYALAKKTAAAVGTAASAVGTAINPNSADNLIYQGVTAVGNTLTGTSDFSLGGWLYDITHAADPFGGPLPAATDISGLTAAPF